MAKGQTLARATGYRRMWRASVLTSRRGRRRGEPSRNVMVLKDKVSDKSLTE